MHEDITMPCLYLIWSMIVVIWVLRFIIILPRRQMTDWWLYIVVITSELVITLTALSSTGLTNCDQPQSEPGLTSITRINKENWKTLSISPLSSEQQPDRPEQSTDYAGNGDGGHRITEHQENWLVILHGTNIWYNQVYFWLQFYCFSRNCFIEFTEI